MSSSNQTGRLPRILGQCAVPRRQCHHCREWIETGEPHDCWTTTIEAATADLTEELRDAWERLHETAAALGDQRIYASHKSIMFARGHVYCFVRPKRSFLELVVFLGRSLRAPQIRRSDARSRTKVAHTLHIRHRDEVESPISDWLGEAYAFAGGASQPKRTSTRTRRRAAKR
jgi:hypothetical protein